MNKLRHLVLAGASAVFLTILGGCGTGEYETRLDQTKTRLVESSFVRQMTPPVDVPGTPISLQMPKYFEQAPWTEDSEIDGQPVDPRRLTMPDAVFSDQKLTFEGFYTYLSEDGSSEEGKIAFYCYVAVTNTATGRTKDPVKPLYTKFTADMKGIVGRRLPVECETAEGRSVEWRRFVVPKEGVESDGPTQEFLFIDKEGAASYSRTNATLSIFTRKYGDYFVAVAWRVPTAIKDEPTVELEKWSKHVAATVTNSEGGNE